MTLAAQHAPDRQAAYLRALDAYLTADTPGDTRAARREMQRVTRQMLEHARLDLRRVPWERVG